MVFTEFKVIMENETPDPAGPQIQFLSVFSIAPKGGPIGSLSVLSAVCRIRQTSEQDGSIEVGGILMSKQSKIHFSMISICFY